jgi:hypothetical protein
MPKRIITTKTNKRELYDLSLSRRLRLIKFSRASSRVKLFKVDKTDVSRTISVLVLVLRETEDKTDVSRTISVLVLRETEDKTDVSRTISVLVLRETEVGPTSPRGPAHSYKRWARAGIYIYMTWTGLQPTSVSLRMRTEMVPETSVLSTFNHLTRLEARENFIKYIVTSGITYIRIYIAMMKQDKYVL